MQQTTTIKTSSCKQAYIYLFPRESLPGLHLGCSENSVTLSGCSSLYNDIPNAICSHGHSNKVYLPRSVCHPSLFLHVFPRNLHRVRLSLPRISPHPVCLSFEIHEQHQSWSCILLFLHVHMFNSLPLQCCGNTQVPSQPVEEHLAELLDLFLCNRCTYAYMGRFQRHAFGSSTGKVR